MTITCYLLTFNLFYKLSFIIMSIVNNIMIQKALYFKNIFNFYEQYVK